MFFQIDSLTYRHPGLAKESTPALNNISLSIAEGEWVALLGANGSGKTTLARALNALIQPSSGRVMVDGLDTSQLKHLALIRSKVGMVFQSPEDQIVASLVSEDTAFGPENLALPTAEVQNRIQAALESVGMWEQRERPPHLLSAGQIQRVALAGVLAMQPRCIIFDETTAMLDPIGKRDVLTQMQHLHEQGMTIIMITHSMDEAALAERALLLNKGHLVYDGISEALFNDEPLLKSCQLEIPTGYQLNQLVHRYFPGLAGSSVEINSLLNALPVCPSSIAHNDSRKSHLVPSTDIIIEVEELQHSYLLGTPMAQLALSGVNLQAIQGKAHGLVGATGSGKSTLLQHLNGLYLPQAGKVRVGQFETNDPGVDLRGLRRFAGLVFQNPELYFFEQYVGDEIAYGAKLNFGRERLRERVRQAMETVGLDFETFKDRLTSTLSGGEKRKVALASALVVEPKLLILDEPSAGLDPLSRRGLIKTLQELQVGGNSLVLSSHNMEDIAALAEEMTIMKQGKSLMTGRVGELFANQNLMQQADLIPPAASVLAADLRANGWPIPMGVVTLVGVDACLASILGGGKQ
ncbi:MAG: ABC transporter ATP-binding protein [Anaerolineaceae bacterium]